MECYTFALTELTYQVPPPTETVGLPVIMLASVKPAELNRVTSDALSVGYSAEVSAAYLRQAAEDRLGHLDRLQQINNESRENISDGVAKRQKIARSSIRFNGSPPASLLEEIYNGLTNLEKPAVSEELEADINLASVNAKHTGERAVKAERLKKAVYEQTLLAKEIELKRRHLGRAVRIGSALTSAVIIGGSTFGLLHESIKQSDARAEKIVSQMPADAQTEFAERYNDESDQSRYILIGALGLSAATFSGLNGYIISRRPAARFAQYRARRIIKKAK